ncbi:MAG: hypothetical protein ABJ251_18030 [Paracoccaceae bacterium]
MTKSGMALLFCIVPFGIAIKAEAQDLSAFADCAVLEAETTWTRSANGVRRSQERIQIVPGVGSSWQNEFYSQALPSGHSQPKNFVCKHPNTQPALSAQVKAALDAHLTNINNSIADNTVEVQQTIANSFAIQIDMLAVELADIRSLLPEVDEADAAIINERLDQIDARLEALKQASGN